MIPISITASRSVAGEIVVDPTGTEWVGHPDDLTITLNGPEQRFREDGVIGSVEQPVERSERLASFSSESDITVAHGDGLNVGVATESLPNDGSIATDPEGRAMGETLRWAARVVDDDGQPLIGERDGFIVEWGVTMDGQPQSPDAPESPLEAAGLDDRVELAFDEETGTTVESCSPTISSAT